MTEIKTYLYNRKIELLETCSEETNQYWIILLVVMVFSTVAGKEVAVISYETALLLKLV